jgi:hypothetical protein
MAKGKVQMANGWTESTSTQPAAASRLLEPSQPGSELLAGYHEMANDPEHEAEGREWCEGLIGDAVPQDE